MADGGSATRMSVLVVCDQDDTVLHLPDYLAGAGLAPRATRRLDEAWSLVRSVDATVLFPDDFPLADIDAGLGRALPAARGAFILVTGLPRVFEPVVARAGGGARARVLHKPVWSWTILDVLREESP